MSSIFVAIPNTGTLRTELVEWLMIHNIKPYMPQAKPHDHCRNIIVDEFLKTDCEYLLMIDSDVVPQDNVLEMVNNNVDVCSAYVRTNYKGEFIPVGMTKNKNGYHHNFKHSKPKLHRVDAVGTGCVLIKRKVFENMAKPYFKFVYKDGILTNGEDFDFCERINNVYFDARYKCKHYTTVGI